MNVDDLKERVMAAYAEREKAQEPFYAMAIRETLNLVDRGVLRVAQKGENGWEVNAWVKEAILLFFSISEMKTMEVPPSSSTTRSP
jgi:2,3,4,5-tetrahydropyridine-2,6-dicarboxylate N-succinyltransferase